MSSKEVIERFRVSEVDWTRHRELTFDRVAILIIRGHKLAGQNNLNKFYKSLGEVGRVPTASAYSQARGKLRGELFLYLNDLIR